ncbi:MAG TPA: HYR domain-containing protein, partial [Bacteroidales bacterium]|nr:HYR domain-containing protein [Bacteroidales bacterium]
MDQFNRSYNTLEKTAFWRCGKGMRWALVVVLMLWVWGNGFAATYTSEQTGNWNDDATWSGTGIPGAGDNVIIISPHTITVNINNATCRNITVDFGGDLILTGNSTTTNINITGNLFVNGTFRDINQDGINIFGGTITIDAAATFDLSVVVNSSLNQLNGNIINNCINARFGRASAYADLEMSGSGILVFSYFDYFLPYTVRNNTHVKILTRLNATDTNNAVWQNNGYLEYSGSNLLMNIDGILEADVINNTIEYNRLVPGPAQGDQTIKDPATSYYNLVLSGDGNKGNLNTLAIDGDLEINGSAVFDPFKVNIKGNWTNNHATDGFTESGSTVTFNGTNQQTITSTGGETFETLIINNSAGINLLNSVSSKFLEMQDGNITTNANELIVTTSDPVASLKRTSGTVVGKLKRSMATSGTYLFPVGTSSYYRPAILDIISGTAGYLTGEFNINNPGLIGYPFTDAYGTFRSSFSEGHWHFEQDNSFSSGNFNITLDGAGFSSYAINANTNIHSRMNSSNWYGHGAHGTVSGSIISRVGPNNLSVNSNTDFCFGTPCGGVDTEKPTISGCPSPITVNNTPGTCSATVTWTEPTATDNCTPAGSLVWTKSDTPGSSFAVGAHTVTYTVKDASGNESDACSFTVTVNDNEKPALTAISDRDENVNASCEFSIPDYTGLTTATDNCTAAGSIVKTQVPAIGTVLSGHNTTQVITITADDGHGNTESTSFTITLKDVTKPALTAISDRDENVNASCEFTIPDYTGLTTATDNCTATGSIVKTQVPAIGTV